MLKFTATAIAMLLALPAMAQDADTVVAKVNGEDITLGQMLAMKSGLPPEATGLPDTALWDLLLDQMIRQTAVAQDGAKTMTARDKAALELDRRAYLSGAALERVAAAEPTEEDLKAVYDKLFGGPEPITEYHAKHILVATEDEARAVKGKLDEGADFAELAEANSTGPSGPNGGDLGWFTADRMVKPFADAVVVMEKGAVSDPVETEFGWHVIMLEDTRTMEAPDFAEIRDQLAMQWRRDQVDAAITAMVGAAKIEKTEGLDAKLLNDTAMLEQ